MRQIYEPAVLQPVFNTVVGELSKIANLPVQRLYRGMAHTLHIHLGNAQKEIIRNKLGEHVHETSDYTLFLHGEWELAKHEEVISSVTSSAQEIDSFIAAHPLDLCTSFGLDVQKKVLKLTFSSGIILSASDRDGAWFVFQKFGQFSYSPQKNGDVEVTKISLVK